MKTRIAFWSEEGSTLAWARRLVDEGCEVLFYTPSLHAREIGAGIVPKTNSRETWVLWGARDPRTIYFFDCTNNGDVADRLRSQGRLVVGAGSFMDRLEMDRAFGQAFAESHGIAVPPTREFTSVSAAVAYMRGTTRQALGDGGWAWKPNKDLGASTTMVGDTEKVAKFCERAIIAKHGDRVSCIVQERIKGVALSTARWWNGKSWTGPYEATLEEKKFMDGDVGPATGCALNTVWFYHEQEPKIAKALKWESLALRFRKQGAPPGLYDINAVVNARGAFFLEWTPRLGIDSELTSQRGVVNLAELLVRLAHGKEIDDLFRMNTAYHGVRLTIPPYPNDADDLAKLKIGNGAAVEGIDSLWKGDFVAVGLKHDRDGFSVADPYGFVGVAVTASPSVEAGFAKIAKAVKKIDVANLQYRTDGATIVSADMREMRATGWPTTSFMEVKAA